jgi:hypothetical protein
MHAPLLGLSTKKRPPKDQEGLAAQRLGGLLVEQDHALAGLDQLRGGDQPGEPRRRRWHPRPSSSSQIHARVLAHR